MPRINLLPWREELRKQKKAEYLAILGVCAALAVAMWFAVHLYFGELINQQNARNAFLQQQITALDKKIAKLEGELLDLLREADAAGVSLRSEPKLPGKLKV